MTSDERRTVSPPRRSWIRDWVSDSALLLVSQALAVVATSLAAIMIARSLEPEDWGVFSAFLGLSLAFAIIVDFGLATYLLRELSALLASGQDESQLRAEAGRLAGASIVMNASLALPLVIGGVIYAVLSATEASLGIVLVCLLAYGGLTAAATSLETHMRARRQVPLVVGASLLEKSFLIGLVFVAFVTGAGLAGVGLAYVTAALIRVAFDAWVVFRRYGLLFTAPLPKDVLSVVRSSLPFALAASCLNVIPRLDTFVLVTLSSSTAAWFAIGDRTLGPALLVPATLGSALYPFMASRGVRRAQSWRLAGLMGLFGASIAVTGILLAPTLIPLVFGSDYEEAIPVVQVMMLVLPVIYSTSPMLVSAYSRGAERSLFLPILLISLVGTLAIVIGQVLRGAELAAVGFVFRSLLFFVVIGIVGGRATGPSAQGGEKTLKGPPTIPEGAS